MAIPILSFFRVRLCSFSAWIFVTSFGIYKLFLVVHDYKLYTLNMFCS
jgi:hypothetical protein